MEVKDVKVVEVESPIKAQVEEVDNPNQQHDEVSIDLDENNVETDKLVKNQGNLDAIESPIASKVDKPNLVSKTLEEGADLGSNEDAILATSSGKVILKDLMEQRDNLEENREENENNVD